MDGLATVGLPRCRAWRIRRALCNASRQRGDPSRCTGSGVFISPRSHAERKWRSKTTSTQTPCPLESVVAGNTQCPETLMTIRGRSTRLRVCESKPEEEKGTLVRQDVM